jgi:hypothetical protein
VWGGPGGDWAWYQNVDTPVDGLPDGWERQWFGTTTRDGNGDFDSDGWLDSEEFVDGTDPTEADTDRDGVIDASDTAPLDPLTP